jgi:uncharacterized protein YbjQ (UPF0145 family)
MTIHYNVVFEGKTAPGKDIGSVKKQLMTLLKIDAPRIDRLFSGKPVVVRKNADSETAEKFRRVFEAAGAICNLEQVEVSGETAAPDQGYGVESQPRSYDKPPTAPISARSSKTTYGGKMVITNIETVPGNTIVEHFGLVSGSTIRAKHVGRDIMASLKNLVGGEIKGYTQLLQESRQQAIDRMIEQARQLGANAIVNVRFSTSSVAQGAAELYAYGTAVRVE